MLKKFSAELFRFLDLEVCQVGLQRQVIMKQQYYAVIDHASVTKAGTPRCLIISFLPLQKVKQNLVCAKADREGDVREKTVVPVKN